MQIHKVNGAQMNGRGSGSSDVDSSSQIRLELRSFAMPEREGLHMRRSASVEHALAQWVEDEDRAHILVDAALHVCWMNPAAERLMSRPNSVLIRNGHIRSRENRFDRQLRELVEDAGGEVSVCCLHDPKSGENLLLSARRLAPPFDAFVGLTVALAIEDFEFRLADLHAAFGLTHAEIRVAHLLLSGHTAEETSLDLGVTLETIRTHIKRAYAKLAVSSREAFFHKLAPFLIFHG